MTAVEALAAIDYLASKTTHMADIEVLAAIRAVLADYHGAEAVPRCRHVSDSPWGATQCALPLGHEERHAYSPSEAAS